MSLEAALEANTKAIATLIETIRGSDELRREVIAKAGAELGKSAADAKKEKAAAEKAAAEKAAAEKAAAEKAAKAATVAELEKATAVVKEATETAEKAVAEVTGRQITDSPEDRSDGSPSLADARAATSTFMAGAQTNEHREARRARIKKIFAKLQKADGSVVEKASDIQEKDVERFLRAVVKITGEAEAEEAAGGSSTDDDELA